MGVNFAYLVISFSDTVTHVTIVTSHDFLKFFDWIIFRFYLPKLFINWKITLKTEIMTRKNDSKFEKNGRSDDLKIA